MTDYAAKLRELESTSNVNDDVRRGRALYVRFKPWLDRYHGGLPAGVLAAIMLMESGGKMDAPGDVSLGEVGLYQITASFPERVGIAPAKRYDAETNVFLGGLEYQIGAAEAAKRWPNLVLLGSEDNWKLSRLAFAVGTSGARRLVEAAIAKGYVQRGAVFAGVRMLVDSGGSIALSSGQPADKVRYRVHAIDHNFKVGQLIVPGLYRSPVRLAAPANVGSYHYPTDLLPFTDQRVLPRISAKLGERVMIGAAFVGGTLLGLLSVGIARRARD